MKLLFVCSQNINRSKAAEDLFKDKYNVKSAGFYCDDTASTKLVTRDMVQGADITFVFEDLHMQELKERFPSEYLSKRIVNLDIPDTYLRGDLELDELIKRKVGDYLNPGKKKYF